MRDYLEYMLYCLPLVFITLSVMYMRKFNSLKGTGKIPRIIDAKQRQTLFLILAVVSVLIILIYKNHNSL